MQKPEQKEVKGKNKASFREFEVFRRDEEKRLLEGWFAFGDAFFLLATLVLMLVAEGVFHMNILSWEHYWLLFFANLAFFGYAVFALRKDFKIQLLKYLFAVFPTLLIAGWMYFSNPEYTKILFSATLMSFSMIGFLFYDSRLLIANGIVMAISFTLIFIHYSNIGSPLKLYEMYLMYVFLIMGGAIYYTIIERTRIFLKELLKTRGELEEAKSVLEIKVKARTKELEELSRNLDQKVKQRTVELEESRTSLLNILEDVAESRKEVEEEKNKTLAIITNFTDGLLVFNKEKKLSLINPQAEKFLGVTSAKVLDRKIDSMNRMPIVKPLIKLLGKDMGPLFRKELNLNDNLVLEVSVISILREEEKETLVVLHNITREKLVERMKTEFVSIAAHQLRTPLSAIKWTLKMLLDGDLGRITKEQRKFINKSHQSNERMIDLINDLLNVTRIEEGRYLYEPVATDMAKLIKSLIKEYEDEAEKREVRVEFTGLNKKTPKVLVDVEKISLVIQNLLDNAVRYNHSGGIVSISLDSNEKEVEISIRDTGVGIPKSQQKRIFTKFFRSTNVTKLDTTGSGLGLFIVKNIVEAHGGKVWFESEEGKGANFHFTLPIQK